MASPLAQFEIKKIIPMEMFGYDISFTNSSLAMSVTVLTILIFMLIGLKDLRIVPTKTQTIIESSYEFIAEMIGENIVFPHPGCPSTITIFSARYPCLTILGFEISKVSILVLLIILGYVSLYDRIFQLPFTRFVFPQIR